MASRPSAPPTFRPCPPSSPGAGADGGATPRFAAYGATKRGLAQLTKSLAAELRMLKLRDIGMHNLSPGMVTTDLLMAGGCWERNRRSLHLIPVKVACCACYPDKFSRKQIVAQRRRAQPSALGASRQ